MDLDSRGIPIAHNNEVSMPCPPTPCELCTGKAANGQESWEWCQSVNACAATIDWEEVYGQSSRVWS